jgi:small GTP-binding protein
MSRRSDEQAPKFKAVFIGNSGVGKTALFLRFQNEEFSPGGPATIGGACAKVFVALDSGRSIPFIVWDTAGQETYRGIVPMYFTRCAFILIVYDISNRQSFDSVRGWVRLSKSKAPELAKIVLIGNKSDKEDQRSVEPVEGGDLATELGACMFMETSALSGDGVEALLISIASEATENSEYMLEALSGAELPIDAQPAAAAQGACCG